MKLSQLPCRFAKMTGVLAALTIAMIGCAANSSDQDEAVGTDGAELSVSNSFTARGTGYYPDGSALEGGFVDRKGVQLKTLQQFLAGSAAYVSVAMDVNAFKYGQRLRIHELETKYGQSIIFRVVDTGGAFSGKGKSRIDICVKNEAASVDSTINGTLHIDAIDESTSGTLPPVSTSSSSSSSGSTPTPAPTTTTTAPSTGATCSGDGQCNPGNDGSGQICQSGHCVAGCHTNAQCPGNTTCHSGVCK